MDTTAKGAEDQWSLILYYKIEVANLFVCKTAVSYIIKLLYNVCSCTAKKLIILK